ncbi:uncharacterized protein [Venturia canescens]|uniref:uncharacterized protein n=1 Tax=Venturia canescens TaxID=32260 RepID=UPI001C9BF71B|nr:uncharacterized protein LOC122409658 [Venturia canescens]
MRLLLALFCLIPFVLAVGDNIYVKTSLGGIKGQYKYSEHGRPYYAFEGIPYAKPPVGELRFQPPQPIEGWTGELVATKTGSSCLQYSHVPIHPKERVVGAEDCLYLNVYVPEIESSKKLPVIVWIHGGAFQWHMEYNYYTGELTKPDYLMDRDVIVVTFDYRLGPLGFLSTGDGVVPGNMGLKDQNLALKWVKEHISAFGGDDEQITLTGLSAGGASVHYHYLSPLSRGLFARGISFSGTAFDCWTQTENAAEKAKKLGSILGCPSENNVELIKCLQERPARSILQADGDFMPWGYNPYTPFGPVVEKGSNAPFIDRSPIEIVSSGDVQDLPWITGVVQEEGLYPAADFVADKVLLKELDHNWELIAPFLLDYNYTIPLSKQAEVSRIIRQHYLGSKSIDTTTTAPLIQMVGDRIFIVDGVKAAKLTAKINKSPVWYYYFTYRGANSASDAMSHTTQNFGVAHGDDTYYVVGSPFVDPTTTADDRAMQRYLLDFWVSFATTGIPYVGIEWPKLDPSKEGLQYLHIKAPGESVIEYNTDFGQYKFWNSIDFNENKLKGQKIDSIIGKKIIDITSKLRTQVYSSSNCKFNEKSLFNMKLLLFLFCLVPFVFAVGDNIYVKTSLGGIKGQYKYSEHGRLYYAFEGIPYAKPPVGKLRFQPPQPIEGWTGELVATKTGSLCLQYSQVPIHPKERVVGAEDCLYLNIYVPELESSKRLPIIVWIHGGAFQWHMEYNYYTGEFTKPDYLMDRDVIVVTFNYRLGPLGFLSTGDKVVPGNMGLKDQSLALKWIKEHIGAFGGDDEQITLFGLSAGGASVHYHYLSPLSHGLFTRGMSMSGTAFNCWTQIENSAEKAKKLGSILGCPSENNVALVKCLQERPARNIIQADGDFMPWGYNPYTPFGPVIEKGSDAPFIDRSPIEIISSGSAQDLPWITGNVKEEGTYPAADFVADAVLLKELDHNWELIAPFLLDYNYTIPLSKQVEVSRIIRQHYLGSKSIDTTVIAPLIRMIGDRVFIVDGVKAAKQMARFNESPVLYYYFSYRGANSASDAMSHTTQNFGVAHGDDAYYVVGSPSVDPTTTADDRAMQRYLLDFWVSFATTGIPYVGIQWPKVNPSKEGLHYLHIKTPQERVIEYDTDFGQYKFWNSIDFNENRLKGQKIEL